MITDIAWNAFKQTGDIKTYLEFKELKNIEKDIKGSSNETDKSKWSDFT